MLVAKEFASHISNPSATNRGGINGTPGIDKADRGGTANPSHPVGSGAEPGARDSQTAGGRQGHELLHDGQNARRHARQGPRPPRRTRPAPRVPGRDQPQERGPAHAERTHREGLRRLGDESRPASLVVKSSHEGRTRRSPPTSRSNGGETAMTQFHLSAAFVERLGWVLVHSVWQFALIALAALVLQRVMQRASSATRYWVLLLALVTMMVAPVATWLAIPHEGQDAE